MTIETIYYFLIFFLDIPSGAISDIISRKLCLIISSLANVFGCLFVFFFADYFYIVIAQIFFAIAATFLSGTDSAFLYDTLLDLNDGNSYEKHEGRTCSIIQIGITASLLVSGFLAKVSLSFPFFITAIFSLIGAVIAFFFTEPSKLHNNIINGTQTKKNLSIIWGQIVKNVKIIRNNKPLINITIYSAIIYCLLQSTLWLNQSYFINITMPIISFGIISAAISLLTIIISWNYNKIIKIFPLSWSLLIIPISLSISYLGMSYSYSIFGVGFILFQVISRGLFRPTVRSITNKMISSENRATILSFESSIGNFLFAIISPAIGYCLDKLGIHSVLLFLSLAGIILLISNRHVSYE